MIEAKLKMESGTFEMDDGTVIVELPATKEMVYQLLDIADKLTEGVPQTLEITGVGVQIKV